MPKRAEKLKKVPARKERHNSFSKDEAGQDTSEDGHSGNTSDSDSQLSEEIAAGRNAVVDTWEFPIVDQVAGKHAKYIEALKKAQLKIGELQAMIRKLHIRNVKLATQALKYRKHKKAQKSTKAKMSNEDHCIAQLGRCFGIMNEPFVPQTALLVPKPSVFSTDPRCYESESSMLEGIVAELYEEVPPDLHEKMSQSPDFRKVFLHHLHSCRRTMIHQLRSTTAPQIFGHPHEYYQTEYNQKDLQLFQSQLKFPGEEKYSKFAPILFPNNKRDMQKLFCSIPLTKILKTILFGLSLLNSKKKPSLKTQGQMWGVRVVTPGNIAISAVVSIFVHSPDREFAPVGAISSIPYTRWYNHYKSYLMNSAHKKHIRKLFAWWNGWVFLFDQSKNPAGDDMDSSGMEEAEMIGDESSGNDFEDFVQARRTAQLGEVHRINPNTNKNPLRDQPTNVINSNEMILNSLENLHLSESILHPPPADIIHNKPFESLSDMTDLSESLDTIPAQPSIVPEVLVIDSSLKTSPNFETHLPIENPIHTPKQIPDPKDSHLEGPGSMVTELEPSNSPNIPEIPPLCGKAKSGKAAGRGTTGTRGRKKRQDVGAVGGAMVENGDTVQGGRTTRSQVP